MFEKFFRKIKKYDLYKEMELKEDIRKLKYDIDGFKTMNWTTPMDMCRLAYAESVIDRMGEIQEKYPLEVYISLNVVYKEELDEILKYQADILSRLG